MKIKQIRKNPLKSFIITRIPFYSISIAWLLFIKYHNLCMAMFVITLAIEIPNVIMWFAHKLLFCKKHTYSGKYERKNTSKETELTISKYITVKSMGVFITGITMSIICALTNINEFILVSLGIMFAGIFVLLISFIIYIAHNCITRIYVEPQENIEIIYI